jgi:hypothetical protein
VDHCLSNLAPRLGARGCDAQDRAAKDRDLIGERWRDAEDAEELVVVIDQLIVIVGGLFLDDDSDVFDKGSETIRQLVECLFDELPEFVR